MFRGIAYTIISAFCFATLVIFGKIGYSLHLEALRMLTIRFEFGALSLLIFFLITDRKALIPTKRLLTKTFVTGLGLYLWQSFMFFKAIEYIPASTASLILYVYPLMVLIISLIFLKEKFRISSFISVLLILGGCSLVFYDAFMRQISLTGVIYALVSMVLFSLYLVISQIVMKNENPMSSAFYIVLFTLCGYMMLNGGTGLEGITLPQIGLGLCLGVIPSAFAIAFLYKGIEKIGAAYFSIFSSIEPVITLILAGVFLGEKIVIYQIFGVILLIAGIIVPNLRFIKS